tara:strand:- start:89 stop:814 length:726 start_codon:yes stop_codon:yes gene_type:complete
MSQYNDFNNQKLASYSELTQDQLIARLTDDSTSPEELEKIMAFLAEKDSEAQQERSNIEARLNKQYGGPQIGERLTGMHNAIGNMSKVVNIYAKNSEKRMAKWDLVHTDYKTAVLEMLDLFRQRLNLVYSVRVSLKDTSDKLIPNMELDPTKDPWEEMDRSNKEVEDTEDAFKKEMEKVTDFTKLFHEMPEYKEITAKLSAVQERINGYQMEYKAITNAEDKDQEKATNAMKKVDEAGKKL